MQKRRNEDVPDSLSLYACAEEKSVCLCKFLSIFKTAVDVIFL